MKQRRKNINNGSGALPREKFCKALICIYPTIARDKREFLAGMTLILILKTKGLYNTSHKRFYDKKDLLYLRESVHLEDLGLDRGIILRWIFRKWAVGYGLDPAGSG
jgi:hypothetical protein